MAVIAKPRLLAGDSWVRVLRGVKHVSDLKRGDELFLVRPNGTISTSTIQAVRLTKTTSRCTSLLTKIGEVLLPEGSRVITRNGLERVEDVACAFGRGQAARIEVIQPGDLTPPSLAEGSRRDGYRAVLGLLARPNIIIPTWLEQDSGVGEAIEAIFTEAVVAFKRYSLENWTVFSFDGIAPHEVGIDTWPAVKDAAEALILSAAWTTEREQVVARVLYPNVRYLQRLCGSLAGVGESFEVRWLPGYRPTEARVLRTPDCGVGSHVPVLRAAQRIQDLYEIDVAGAGAIVVGSALVS